MSPELRHILDLMIYAQADLATGESAAKVYWHADDDITFSIARKQIEKAIAKLGEALTSFPDNDYDKEIHIAFGPDGSTGYITFISFADRSKQPDTSYSTEQLRSFGYSNEQLNERTVSPEDQGN